MTTTKSVAASAIAGIRWNYLGSAFSIICSMTIGTVLARLLGPGPFGQAIIATTVYGFVNLFVNGGFSQVLIQKQDLSQLDIRRTFTFQVALGLLTTLLVLLIAPFVAARFHDPSAVPVIRAMSLMITFQAFGLVSAALLRRSMRFKVIQYAGIASYLVGYLLIGIPLARYGWGVWSLVLAYLSQALLTSILLYAAARHTIVPSFHLPDRSSRAYGGAVIASNVVNWGHSNLDNLASSRLGPFALGLYGRACNLAYQPVQGVVNTLQSVLLSSTAKVQERPELVRNMVLSMLGIAFGILGPAYVALAFVPDTVIVGLYGIKWSHSVPLMVPLALAMPFFGGMSMLGPVLSGLGRPALEFWPQAISCGVAAIAFFTAARFSLLGIAWALFSVSVLRMLAISGFTFRLLKISWMTALAIIAKRMIVSIGFGALIFLVDRLLRLTSLGVGARLSVVALIGLVLFCGLLWTMAHLLFGRHAINFLLGYAAHLPSRYVRQLRIYAPITTPSTLAKTDG